MNEFLKNSTKKAGCSSYFPAYWFSCSRFQILYMIYVMQTRPNTFYVKPDYSAYPNSCLMILCIKDGFNSLRHRYLFGCSSFIISIDAPTIRERLNPPPLQIASLISLRYWLSTVRISRLLSSRYSRMRFLLQLIFMICSSYSCCSNLLVLCVCLELSEKKNLASLTKTPNSCFRS